MSDHKVIALDADYIAPTVTLRQLLEKIDLVETVVVVAYLKEGGVHVGHSSGDDSRLVYMAVCADEFMRQKVREP